MARTAKPSVASAARSASQGEMLEAVHQIWLAGMGAVANARKEGSALLNKETFDKLLEEGARIYETARKDADRVFNAALEQVQSTVGARVKDAQSQAGDALDNLEKIFQTRVHRALNRLGVPSADEVAALSKRVQVLTDNVSRLGGRRRAPAANKRATPRRTRGRRAA